MAFLAATLDTDGETSDAEAVPLGSRPLTLIAGVDRTAGNANFDVRLQVGVYETGSPYFGQGGTVRWFDVLTLDMDGAAKSVVPATGHVAYRFRVASAGTGNTLRCLATL